MRSKLVLFESAATRHIMSNAIGSSRESNPSRGSVTCALPLSHVADNNRTSGYFIHVLFSQFVFFLMYGLGRPSENLGKRSRPTTTSTTTTSTTTTNKIKNSVQKIRLPMANFRRHRQHSLVVKSVRLGGW